MIFESAKFGINKEQCELLRIILILNVNSGAKSVLPFLMSTCIETSLNLQQFSQFMQLVHQLLEKVESEQRQCLQQLSASQES
jgi:hypothetical protein